MKDLKAFLNKHRCSQEWKDIVTGRNSSLEDAWLNDPDFCIWAGTREGVLSDPQLKYLAHYLLSYLRFKQGLTKYLELPYAASVAPREIPDPLTYSIDRYQSSTLDWVNFWVGHPVAEGRTVYAAYNCARKLIPESIEGLDRVLGGLVRHYLGKTIPHLDFPFLL